MSVFQWIMLPLLALVALLELARFARDRRRLRLLRTAVWIVAALLIADPDSATSLAQAVGIGRGTDFVFYVFMLVTLAALFRLYSHQFRMRQDIVLLVRREALRSAQPGYGLGQLSVGLPPNWSDSFERPSASGDSPRDSGERRE